MSTTIKAYAARAKGASLEPFEFNPGPLRDEHVEIAVTHCGLCHSDLSMLDNEWGMTAFPFVPGHEVIGTVVATGSHVKRVKIGQRVGLGWFCESCMACEQCLTGLHHLCIRAEQTIVNRHGGFAERVRAHWAWATPLPSAIDPAKGGPLFCGGATAFNPIANFGVKPTDRVGVIGIGGLGHLAIQFFRKWGCEVIAFTSSESKTEEARQLGAHTVVNSGNAADLKSIAGSLDFILSTVNVKLDWSALVDALKPNGRLHTVGAVLEPIEVAAFSLIVGQKSLSGSPVASPATTVEMLDFCARHAIAPVTETFPMSRLNDALEHLRAGKARYRIVLENDFGSSA